MSKKVHYVVVSPVRNEGQHLPLTIKCMIAQTVAPTHWIIVNDGSTDQTRQLAEEAAHAYPWIQVINRPDRGYRKAGGGVMDAFYAGYRLVEDKAWDYLVKLDGDLSFTAEYFEQCFQRFDENPRLGIAGGTICSDTDGVIDVESKIDPKFHVRGATKIYRRACWRDIGCLIKAPGWDTLDEVKANMLGWVTFTFRDVTLIHHRPTGAAYGTLKDMTKSGMANYIAGYHPLFMLIKCLRRMAKRPYFFGGCALLFGFIKGYVDRIPRVDDKALVDYFRRQQMNRLLFRRSLWD
jgi:poly-beta-1,6-N-acetyl-D-glucosamine synthase